MRWDNLLLTGDDTRPDAPLIERSAITRTFDTPEFRGITFYEIQARSLINKVPAVSRVPFTWTINPYRGCSHSCSYCISGDTDILLANGRTKPIKDLCVGDEIYGTERQGRYRRYVKTAVLAHWRTLKPAYRISLADGSQILASADHRFLTERGWKYVTDGERQRPHLTTNDKLIGTGGFAEPPKMGADYRRGYLSAQRHLADFGVPTTEWPPEPSIEWRKGFLAGIFDAEGHISASSGTQTLRISNTDTEIVDRIAEYLPQFCFSFVRETSTTSTGKLLVSIWVLGGLREQLRFFHTFQPAITRKMPIEGRALESGARVQVEAIEPTGLEIPMYDITTGTGDFIANGVVSHNCFARKTHEYLDFDSGADFDSRIVVKVNAGELVRKELAAAKWRGEHIAMGTNVDCYQRAEGRYRLMPQILTALRDARNPFSILTKGSLILRDLPLLEEAAELTEVGTAVSVGFLDKDLWRIYERGTPSPYKRLEVCATLNEHGIGCGVLMGPILPYLTDSPRQIDEAVRRIAQAGATSVSAIPLHLRPGAREWFLRSLREHHPELVVPYAKLYGPGAYAPKDYQERITRRVREAAQKHGLDRRGRTVRPVAQPPAGPTQLTLM
jgi:DNA repair photolyase